MKINTLDAHDRYKYLSQKDFSIDECIQDIIRRQPFGNRPFYVFAHARTDDDGATKRLIWQPRLTKPKAQTNSMLFKVFPNSETIHVKWMIPDRFLWPNYQIGNICQNETILTSIWYFENAREQLESPDEDDPSDEEINKIYEEISRSAKYKV